MLQIPPIRTPLEQAYHRRRAYRRVDDQVRARHRLGVAAHSEVDLNVGVPLDVVRVHRLAGRSGTFVPANLIRLDAVDAEGVLDLLGAGAAAHV